MHPQIVSHPDCGAASRSVSNVSETSIALERLDRWIESENFQGWDPHDALNSPIIRALVGENRLLKLIALQGVRRSPINLRQVLRVPKSHNPKAMGLFLTTYAHKYCAQGKAEHLHLAKLFAEWLAERSTPGFAGPCWGYNFDWINRSFFATAGTPTLVNTAFVGLSFLEAEDLLNSIVPKEDGGRTGKGKSFEALQIARGSCDFILGNLNIYRPNATELCFSYTPIDRRFVHNANLLGAQLLAAVHARTGEPELRECALSAARFTTSRQGPDGSWVYGIDGHDQWIDNFHTGFVLIALSEIGRLLEIDEFEAAIRKGYEFWKRRMFAENGVPKYYPNRTYPIDVHCVAQALLTFLHFSDCDREALGSANRLAEWAINNLQDAAGFFHYQLHRWHRIRIPYMRWGQAWMQLALTKLQAKSESADNSAHESSVEVADAC